jgi:hypothetical protein
MLWHAGETSICAAQSSLDPCRHSDVIGRPVFRSKLRGIRSCIGTADASRESME